MPPVRRTRRLVNLRPGPANTQALDDALATRQRQREANAQSGSQRRVYTPEQLVVFTQLAGIRADPTNPGMLLPPDPSLKKDRRTTLDGVYALLTGDGHDISPALRDYINKVADLIKEQEQELENSSIAKSSLPPTLPLSWLPEILRQEQLLRRIQNNNPSYRPKLDLSESHPRTQEERNFAMAGNICRIDKVVPGQVEGILASELCVTLAQQNGTMSIASRNAQELAEARVDREDIIRQNRAPSTTKIYNSKISAWRKWCLEVKQYEDCDLVTEDKLYVYLKQEIIPTLYYGIPFTL